MRENPFMSFNHIKIGVVESDHAEVWLDIQPESTNIYGVVHFITPKVNLGKNVAQD